MKAEVRTKEDDKKRDYLLLQTGGKRIRIPLLSILYVTSSLRKLVIVEKKRSTEVYGKLSELEELLKNYGFYRCHQSFLVNELYIREYRRKELLLNNLERIPVSRSRSRENGQKTKMCKK